MSLPRDVAAPLEKLLALLPAPVRKLVAGPLAELIEAIIAAGREP